jgi:hypothetical protein
MKVEPMSTRRDTPPTGLLPRLARVNRTVAFLVTVAVVLLGLFLPGILGGAVLFALAAGLAALLARTWPVQAPATRVLRVVVLAVLVVVALSKIL